MSDPNITIQQTAFHRNGITGEGFHVILFRIAGDASQKVAILFPTAGRCAVLDVGQLHAGDIAFGSNSYCGDQFETVLRGHLHVPAAEEVWDNYTGPTVRAVEPDAEPGDDITVARATEDDGRPRTVIYTPYYQWDVPGHLTDGEARAAYRADLLKRLHTGWLPLPSEATWHWWWMRRDERKVMARARERAERMIAALTADETPGGVV